MESRTSLQSGGRRSGPRPLNNDVKRTGPLSLKLYFKVKEPWRRTGTFFTRRGERPIKEYMNVPSSDHVGSHSVP